MLSSVRFLSRQGLALRGDGNESDSNFMQLINLCSEDDERILDWIKKKRINTPHHKCKLKWLKLWVYQFFERLLQILEVHYFIPLWWMKQQTWQIQNNSGLPAVG